MSKKIQCIYGTHDILPGEAAAWQRLETAAASVFQAAGYREIRTPIIEDTSLFVRGTGETTDIVQKEMYTFSGGDDASISLRPEGTPPVVRAFIQHSLFSKQGFWKLYYVGPMFRRERPQKGRQRQFHQIGVEALGAREPLLDAEIIALAVRFFDALGLPGFSVQINTIGCPQCRPAYRNALSEALLAQKDRLCDDCKQRLERNVLRVLDCRQRGCMAIVDGLPGVADFLCPDCREHRAGVVSGLDLAGVEWVEDARLVRGLDYYTRTVFEVTHDALGSRNAICGGGRYDNLVEELGGPATPAAGFAIGSEATLLALEATVGADWHVSTEAAVTDIFVVTLDGECKPTAFALVDRLRREGFRADMDYESRSLKAQMRAADRQGARFAAVIGSREMEAGTVNLKDMASGDSEQVPLSELAGRIGKR